MYCNFAKNQAFPLVLRISSRPKCFKPSQKLKFPSFSNGVYSKPSIGVKPRSHSNGVCLESPENVYLVKPRNFSSGLCQKGSENPIGAVTKPRSLSSRVYVNSPVQTFSIVSRKFSNGYPQKAGDGGSGGVRGRKNLPWIASAYKNKGPKSSDKGPKEKVTSSWEESANKFLMKNGVNPVVENREVKSRRMDPVEHRSRYGERDQNEVVEEVGRRSRYVERDQNGAVEEIGRRSRYVERDQNGAVEEAEEEKIDDPRWDKIQNRYRRINERQDSFEKPEFRRWNKQESWGQKTWKEATVSTIPRMTGEGIYGVGPVLAALSAGRREFYTLYVKEGLDLNSTNKKKKDKKGFEKVLKIAEKIGLTVKDTSKHDLNMMVDNRPHQGLVLDASPLETVNIRELEPVLVERETGPLWVALDEVMDPQNLGAIVRSAYFFGAAGVVLCAKNSSPLTGVVSKASAGSLELMELRSCKNMMQFLSSSAENGWRVIGGSVSSRALPINEVPAGAPTILVLGSEGKGLRPLVERSCTELIRIPGNIPVDISARGAEDENAEEVDRSMGEELQSFLAVESLNVSVAAGVLLHHLIGSNNKKQAS